MSERYIDKGIVYDKINIILEDYAKLSTEDGTDMSAEDKKALKSKKTALLLKIKPIDQDFYEVVTANEIQKRPPSLIDWMKRKITWSE